MSTSKSSLDALEPYFKPEVRNAARDLLAKDLVSLQRGTDTRVLAYIQTAARIRVTFQSASISSPKFTVDCTCPAFKRGQFCKHIWATLELVQEQTPDFLESKIEIEKQEVTDEPAVTTSPSEEQKLRQAEYRKKVYQAQKLRKKELTKEQKATGGDGRASRNFRAGAIGVHRHTEPAQSKTSARIPDSVREACAYFTANGFPLAVPFDEADVHHAKRVLSRVFHPDRGGTHDEMLELLKNAELLLNFQK